jgi:hypothetical protein
MAHIVFESFADTNPYRYTGPFNENIQMLVDTFCDNDKGAVIIHTDEGQTIYQHQAVYSQEQTSEERA